MVLITERQANWIADLLESGHIHYELKEYLFENVFYRNGRFVEERDNRKVKQTNIFQYTRDEYIRRLIGQPRDRFKRFLSRYVNDSAIMN